MTLSDLRATSQDTRCTHTRGRLRCVRDYDHPVGGHVYEAAERGESSHEDD